MTSDHDYETEDFDCHHHCGHNNRGKAKTCMQVAYKKNASGA